MTFVHPSVLLLLWLVPLAVAGWLWLRRRSRAQLDRIALPSVRGQAKPGAERRFLAQLALAAAGAALALVAAARPCWGEREELVFSKGRNVVLAVDVSRSMLAEDVRPNRLERARADLRDLVADLQGDRAGLLAFRGGAVLVCPLTTDTAFLRQALEHLSPDSAPRGETDLGQAVEAALTALEAFPGDHNAIILISDGEDLAGKAAAAARKAGEQGVPIFTVGIGDTRGATIPAGADQTLQHRGAVVTTRLDNQTLLDIAAASGGKYIPLQTAGTGRITLGTLYRRHLRTIAVRELEERAERRRVERYALFLVPAILCFLGLALLSEGRPARRRRSAPILSATVALCWLAALAPPAASADAGVGGAEAAPTNRAATAAAEPAEATTPAKPRRPGRMLARQAQRAFRAGRYEDAADRYLEAARDPALEPGTTAAFRFNAAIAQLRAGAATNAAASFREALRAGVGGRAALEGLGAALYEAAKAPSDVGDGTNSLDSTQAPLPPARRLALAEEAADAFQQALQGAPEPDRIRRNLAAAAAGIPKLRDEARLAELLERYGQTPPPELLAELLRRQRAAYAAAAAAHTNAGPEQIEQFETAAGQQREAADLWLPLAPQLLQTFSQAVTNREELARLQDRLAAARPSLRAAADRLADLDPAGIEDAARQEQETLGYLVALAPPPLLLEEAIGMQSNALRTALSPQQLRTPAADQGLARALTGEFQRRFPEWADAQSAQAAQAAQAVPPQNESHAAAPEPLAPETRAEIEQLVSDTLRRQEEVLAAGEQPAGFPAPGTQPAREMALKNLLRIRELLPKPPSQSSQKPSETQPDEPPPSEPQSSNPQDNPESGEPPPDQPENDGTPPPGDDEEKERQNAEEGESEEPPPEDLQEMMERVLRLEKEREEERRRRQRELPPLLNERDW